MHALPPALCKPTPQPEYVALQTVPLEEHALAAPFVDQFDFLDLPWVDSGLFQELPESSPQEVTGDVCDFLTFYESVLSARSRHDRPSPRDRFAQHCRPFKNPIEPRRESGPGYGTGWPRQCGWR